MDAGTAQGAERGRVRQQDVRDGGREHKAVCGGIEADRTSEKIAVRLDVRELRVEYFAGERWLPDDRVAGIGFDRGSTWIETAKGFSRIDYTQTTLADKSRAFVERIQARHNREKLRAYNAGLYG